MGAIHYRAVHTKSQWRKVNNHQSLAAAVTGKDGAAGLFARKVRINYDTHGDPLYVVVWEDAAPTGLVIAPDPGAPDGIRQVSVPIDEILAFERKGRATLAELQSYFAE